MAASVAPSTQFLSGDFVVSAGSVLFRKTEACHSGIEICLLYQRHKHEWLLPKGRKDCGETIDAAAIRETFEETGYPCELLPCRMPTRAPIPGTNAPDAVNVVDSATEPIAVTVRNLGEKGLKLIWWYVARATGEKVEGTQTDSEEFDSHFVDAEEAIDRLSFRGDRDIATQALALVRDGKWVHESH